MEPIREGMTGTAVEDVQERLASLGYEIAVEERGGAAFGQSTANAVARFRLEHNLSLTPEVDVACWSALVDECYQMGDRTLYLRLPNFHGNDVRCLQNALNVLGFSCGEVDGYYGPHTEGAVKMFQENVGMLADGIAFSDTFDALERLRHVWAGKPANGPHPQSGMGIRPCGHSCSMTPTWRSRPRSPSPETSPDASGTSRAPRPSTRAYASSRASTPARARTTPCSCLPRRRGQPSQTLPTSR